MFNNRDKASLDILRLRDESVDEFDNLLDSDVLVREIDSNLEAAFEQFRDITTDLGREHVESEKS